MTGSSDATKMTREINVDATQGHGKTSEMSYDSESNKCVRVDQTNELKFALKDMQELHSALKTCQGLKQLPEQCGGVNEEIHRGGLNKKNKKQKQKQRNLNKAFCGIYSNAF
ncbi:hypothetical protein Pint_33075 [Pistacia integerrima]|uniref:Uncharacterized protein n=1 Tax=Pistacia integerrima TaxID=434235 RepID=A0ACC0X9T9_9ROSI|nr:hypothetical protein Pint_33075 [Pistacia integerrima]